MASWAHAQPSAVAGGERNEEEESWYFGEYSRLATHREMLEDLVRTGSYYRAIVDCCQDKVVLDIGCGSGILSLFAAKAGARKVVAVEASADMAAFAREAVDRNGFADKVDVVCGRLEDVADDVEAKLQAACDEGSPAKADVLLSEWMGYMLVHEDMFSTVAFARDRWLAPGGRVLPASCSLWVAPFSGKDLVAELGGFWKSSPWGFDLSHMAAPALAEVLRRPVIDVLESPKRLLATPSELWRLRCAFASASQPRCQNLSFDFNVSRAGRFHGLAVWFTCTLKPGVAFSTGPEAEPTHWAQTLLFLSPGTGWPERNVDGLRVRPGDQISGELGWEQSGRGMRVRLSGHVKTAPLQGEPAGEGGAEQNGGRELAFDRSFDWTLRP